MVLKLLTAHDRFGTEADIAAGSQRMAAFGLRFQPIDATHSENFSAGE